MRIRMKRRSLGTVLGLAAASVALGAMTATPALAADNWSRSTTGANAWGDVWKSSNHYIHLDYWLDDTKADGDCVYLYAEAQQYETVDGWSYWSTTSQSHRVEMCSGAAAAYKHGTLYWNADGNIVDFFTTKVRVELKVCRDVPGGSDNCSGVYHSRSWDVG